MSKYTYIVRDYHAIKEAEIKIDGITVLSGINGCGKSTLSKWLYYVVNGAKEFDNFLYADYKEKISRIINRMQIACMDLSRFKRMNDHIQGKYTLDKLYEATEKLKTLKVYSNEQVENVQDLFLQALHTTTDFLSETLTGNIPDARKSRIFNYFNLIPFIFQLFRRDFQYFRMGSRRRAHANLGCGAGEARKSHSQRQR